MDTILVKKLYLVVKKYDKSYDSSGLLRGELWKWRHDPGYKIVLRVALFLCGLSPFMKSMELS